MEVWEKWILPDINGVLHACSIIDRKSSLDLEFNDSDKSIFLKVIFDGIIFSYRKLHGESFHNTIKNAKLTSLSFDETWSLYKSKSSSFTDWLLLESEGIYSKKILPIIYFGPLRD